MNIEITQKWLEENSACSSGVRWLKTHTGIGALAVTILNDLIATGGDDEWSYFRWLAVRMMTHTQKVRWAVWCAEQVLPIFEKHRPGDSRPRAAIEAVNAWLESPSDLNLERVLEARRAASAASVASVASVASAASAASAAYAAYAASAAYAADSASAASAAYAAYITALTEMRKKCAEKAIEIILES